MANNEENISEPAEDSLQKCFDIVDLEPYENISVDSLNFDRQVKIQLKINRIRTLAELLTLPTETLLNLRGLDEAAVDNILAELDNFFKYGRRNTYLAEKFLRETFHDKISALPDEIKNTKTRRLLQFGKFKREEIFSNLPDDLPLADFPKWLAENAVSFDEQELLNFVGNLQIDLRKYAKKIIQSTFAKPREFDIICWRVKGVTLLETGKNFGLTRERVRQIEISWFNKFLTKSLELKKIFQFLLAFADKKFTLTIDDMKKFIDPFDASVLWYVAPKTDFITFDKEMNALIFHDGNDFDEEQLVKDEKTFNATIEKLAAEKNLPAGLMKVKLAKFFKHSGNFFYRNSLQVTFKFSYILKEKFPDGYKIADRNFYSQFMYYMKELFDDDTPYTPHNIDATLARTSVLCGRGKYIHPDFLNVPPEIMERVKDFIDASDRTSISFKELFLSLKDIFVGTQITNQYFLQGAIRFYKLPYTLRKDYLSKSDENDMSKEFDDFIKKRGKVSIKEIRKHFIAFKNFNIVFLMNNCPDVMRIEEGIYMHASLLNVQEGECEPLKKFLLKKCSKPVHSRLLFDLFLKEFPDFMTRNEIDNHEKLFGVLNHLFKDKFRFLRQYVSIRNVTEDSNRKILLEMLSDKNEVDLSDLIEVCEERHINYGSMLYLIKLLSPEFIRVSKMILKRPEFLGVTDEIISAVVEVTDAAIERNGGWQPAKTFNDYDKLPKLESDWNSFLLESVLSLAEEPIYKIKTTCTKTMDFATIIFVSKEFADDDFKSFVTKILIAEHKKKPFGSEKEILTWLKSEGLCNWLLPAFLSNGKAFKLLGL